MLRGEGRTAVLQMRKQEDMKIENLTWYLQELLQATKKLQGAGMMSLSILSEVIQEISVRGRHLCPLFSGFCFNCVVVLLPSQILIPPALVRLFRSIFHLVCSLLQLEMIFSMFRRFLNVPGEAHSLVRAD